MTSVKAILDYPVTYSALRINGPTLFYLDEEGMPVQVQINNEQVQAVIDDWNAEANLDSGIGEVVTTLKGPLRQ